MQAPPPFADVYRQYFGYVWACLLRWGVPSASVEDALHDVFIVVFRQLPRFEGRSTLSTWLYAITRKVADRHRRTSARAQRKQQALAALSRRAADPTAQLEERHLGAQVIDALQALSADHRRVLVLHLFEEWSGPEIAQALDLNLDTTYSRVKAARRALARVLQDRGVTHDTRVPARPPESSRRRVAIAIASTMGKPTLPAMIGLGTLAKYAMIPVAVAAMGVAVGTYSGRSSSGDPAPAPDAAACRSSEHTCTTEDLRRAAPRALLHEPLPQTGALATAPMPSDALALEIELLSAAKRALERGENDRALAALDQHHRRFPSGELEAEREGYRTLIACMHGAPDGAQRASAHARRFPGSVLTQRIVDACKIPPERMTELRRAGD